MSGESWVNVIVWFLILLIIGALAWFGGLPIGLR